MRFFNVALVSLASLATVGADFAKVVNKCTFPLYLWSVNQSTVGPEQNVTAAGGTYQETYRGEGISIKLSDDESEDSLYDGSPLIQFQYSTDSGTVWYSLAATNGNLLEGYKVALRPSDTSCSKFVWTNGTGTSAVYSCGSAANLVLTLCAA